MDNALATGSIGGVSVAGVLALLFAIYKAVNHKRCRSGCCGKKLEVSMDIESTTPPDKLTIKVPVSSFVPNAEEPKVPKPNVEDK
jgi:hypothetical protein